MYKMGWTNADGKFTCIDCDNKAMHKQEWVIRKSSECIHAKEHRRGKRKVG